MQSITTTAKIQIYPSDNEKELLSQTMIAYQKACNCVSEYIFRNHDLKLKSLNKVLYRRLRNEYGLRSQMAQSVIKTVIAKYKTILENQKKWIKPNFKKPQYDLVWNRDVEHIV
jgi:predicted transposase